MPPLPPPPTVAPTRVPTVHSLPPSLAGGQHTAATAEGQGGGVRTLAVVALQAGAPRRLPRGAPPHAARLGPSALAAPRAAERGGSAGDRLAVWAWGGLGGGGRAGVRAPERGDAAGRRLLCQRRPPRESRAPLRAHAGHHVRPTSRSPARPSSALPADAARRAPRADTARGGRRAKIATDCAPSLVEAMGAFTAWLQVTQLLAPPPRPPSPPLPPPHPGSKHKRGGAGRGAMCWGRTGGRAPRIPPPFISALLPPPPPPPPPPPRTKWTRHVPHPVLIGHAACTRRRPSTVQQLSPVRRTDPDPRVARHPSLGRLRQRARPPPHARPRAPRGCYTLTRTGVSLPPPSYTSDAPRPAPRTNRTRPRPSPRTSRTHRVLHPVLIRHAVLSPAGDPRLPQQE